MCPSCGYGQPWRNGAARCHACGCPRHYLQEAAEAHRRQWWNAGAPWTSSTDPPEGWNALDPLVRARMDIPPKP